MTIVNVELYQALMAAGAPEDVARAASAAAATHQRHLETFGPRRDASHPRDDRMVGHIEASVDQILVVKRLSVATLLGVLTLLLKSLA